MTTQIKPEEMLKLQNELSKAYTKIANLEFDKKMLQAELRELKHAIKIMISS